MPDFSQRAYEAELMDDLSCSGDELTITLRELETINRLLGGNRVTIDALEKLARPRRHQPIAIVDLGCGGGEILRIIRKWSTIRGYNFSLTGIDANENVIEQARRQTPPHMDITFETADIFSRNANLDRFDIVIGTLFFHHFSQEKLIEFFTIVRKSAKIGLIINDIHRHPVAYYSIQWLTRLFSHSDMVINDAPLSVRRAFTREEIESVLKKAGFVEYEIRWMWAFRWQVIARSAQKMA